MISSLSQLKTKLEAVSSGAFQGKVAYRCFPVGGAPALPFICILETESDNFVADGKVYLKRQHVDVELYESHKDPTIEDAIEAMFNTNELIWEKSEQYIDTENTIQIVYEVVI